MANEKRLIDANELLQKVLFRLPIDNQNAEVIAGCVDITRRLIENSPSVDAVEVAHGRWSPVTYGLGVTVTRWMCSNCKKYENSYGRTNYCPNCGAKMDGDGNA